MFSRSLKKMSVIGAVLTLTACGDPQLKLGEEIYNGTCIACHAQGINGAPILGNNKMWAKRAPQGEEVLLEHASQGYGLMPAKGGNTDLSDEEVAAAIKYMLSQLEK
jgi:cytochrome c5